MDMADFGFDADVGAPPEVTGAVCAWLLTSPEAPALAGTFISAGPLDGAATSYTWSGLTSAKTHLVRVNQQSSDGTWYPSPAFGFATINCTPAGSSNSQVATNPGADFTILDFTDHITPGVTTLPTDIIAPGGTIQSCPTMIYIWMEGPSRDALSGVVSGWALRWTVNGTLITTQHSATYRGGAPWYVILTLPGDKSLGKTSQYTLTFSAEGTRPDIQSSVYVSC